MKAKKPRKKISVVISGMPSVGKTTAAEAIAKKYGLQVLAGGDMLKQMALERDYSPSGSDWWDAKEGMRFLSERKTNPEFDKEIDRRLIGHLRKGGVVITSYTLPWLSNLGLKIWFKASQKTRAKRLAGRDSISFAKALKVVKQRDNRNRRLYSKLYGFKLGQDLSVFNFIIDTEKMSANEVAEEACNVVANYASK